MEDVLIWKPEGRDLLQNLDLSRRIMLQRAVNKRGVGKLNWVSWVQDRSQSHSLLNMVMSPWVETSVLPVCDQVYNWRLFLRRRSGLIFVGRDAQEDAASTVTWTETSTTPLRKVWKLASFGLDLYEKQEPIEWVH